MSWICPKCKSDNTRELWDNTGYGGDIKCNNCSHIWDERKKSMAGRPQELINPYRLTIIIEASDRDKLIEKYGHYGISAAIRSVLPILIDYEIPDVIETVEFGSVAHL